MGFVIFSLFNVLWATVYLETWKRYSAELAYRWGTLDQRDELLVEPRPLFTVRTRLAITAQMSRTIISCPPSKIRVLNGMKRWNVLL